MPRHNNFSTFFIGPPLPCRPHTQQQTVHPSQLANTTSCTMYRPETERLIDIAAEALQRSPELAGAPWADLGTGSGAVAIGLADLLAQAPRNQGQRTEGEAGTSSGRPTFLKSAILPQSSDSVAQTAGSGNSGGCDASSVPPFNGHGTANSERPSSSGRSTATENDLNRDTQHSAASVSSEGAALVTAVDLSHIAVAYATYNARLCGLEGRVRVLQGSWYQPLWDLKGRLGGIVSNPPYIPRAQMSGLQAEVGRHEPWSALDGGDDEGLESILPICHGAVHMLLPDGFLALETAGREQAHKVADLLARMTVHDDEQAVFGGVEVLDDCYSVPRFVVARRSSVKT